ncbi:MAG: efflux RND transporter periplasmic adaptor subunit [Alphaproteobacteria bacterium]|nr:efflux RND transporter periplasmic adaptor subunit [Alphaproteobacteria bacterium]
MVRGALAVLGGLLACATTALAEEAALVAVDAVRVEDMAETVRVLGRLVARQRGEVSTRVAGLVAEFDVDVGDHVRQGDVIATLDIGHLQGMRTLAAAEVAESEAALADAEADEAIAAAAIVTAKARVAAAQQELDRLEKLVNSAAFSQARYDDLKQEIVVAESLVAEAVAGKRKAATAIGRSRAAIERSRASLTMADDDVADARILAPYDGVVVIRAVEIGAYVDSGDALVTLLNDTELEIEAEVAAERLAAVTPGLEVGVDLAPGLTVTATVRAVIADENSMTRTRPVRLAFAAPPGAGLAAGQSVEVALPVGPSRRVLTVSKDAILRDTTTSWVFVAAAGQADKRLVVLGPATGDRFEVLDGLREGDAVIVRGNERLAPGQAVSF